MVSFLITLAFVTMLVVTGIIVNMRLYDTGAKHFRQARSLRPAARAYSTGERMSDAEYFARLTRVSEEGPRYARHTVMIISLLVIIVVIVLISLLGGPIH